MLGKRVTRLRNLFWVPVCVVGLMLGKLPLRCGLSSLFTACIPGTVMRCILVEVTVRTNREASRVLCRMSLATINRADIVFNVIVIAVTMFTSTSEN